MTRFFLDAGCWILDTGYWILDAGCWILDAGCWMCGEGSSICILQFRVSDCPTVRLSACLPVLLSAGPSDRYFP